ncbi:hypothetical protein [Saccharopolyspora taberi]|uniref:Uncharacterized protein n=1 Tax=Saccharopolyspora taberi TaxID=60895 RepID=A0ABN3VJW3_9PSEU
MTQGYPQGGWAPPPAGWQPGPARASRGPLLAVGIAAAVAGFLHLLIGATWTFNFALVRYLPLYSIYYFGMQFLAILVGLVGIAGGVLLLARLGWARFLVAGAGALAALDVLAMLTSGVGAVAVPMLFYVLVWVAVCVVAFLPPVGKALTPAGAAPSGPQQWQPQPPGFPQPGPQQFAQGQQFPPQNPPQQFPQQGPPQQGPPPQFPEQGPPPQFPPR